MTALFNLAGVAESTLKTLRAMVAARCRALAGRGKRSFQARPKAWVIRGLVALLLLAGLGFGVHRSMQYSEPEQLVADYLDAVQRKDVAAAFDIAGEPPPDTDRRFLLADAIDPDWTIESIAETDAYGVGSMAVEAVIATESGDTADQTFYFDRERGEWQLGLGAYATVDIGSERFGFLEVNGWRESDNAGQVALYPGVYDFYASLRDYVDIPADPDLLVAGEMEDPVSGLDGLNPEPLSLTEEGMESSQQLVNELVDDCAAAEEMHVAGCPFGAVWVYDPHEPGYLSDLRDLEWEVAEYPEITVVEGYETFDIVDRERGVVEFTGVGSSGDGSEVEFSLECDITAHQLVLDFSEKAPAVDIDPEIEDFGDGYGTVPDEWHTCEADR